VGEKISDEKYRGGGGVKRTKSRLLEQARGRRSSGLLGVGREKRGGGGVFASGERKKEKKKNKPPANGVLSKRRKKVGGDATDSQEVLQGYKVGRCSRGKSGGFP